MFDIDGWLLVRFETTISALPVVHLRELLSSLPPTLQRTIGALNQQSTPRSIMTIPAALVQADLAPPHHDVRLELRCDQHRLDPQEIDALASTYALHRC